jgi:hypothetical protein
MSEERTTPNNLTDEFIRGLNESENKPDSVEVRREGDVDVVVVRRGEEETETRISRGTSEPTP